MDVREKVKVKFYVLSTISFRLCSIYVALMFDPKSNLAKDFNSRLPNSVRASEQSW